LTCDEPGDTAALQSLTGLQNQSIRKKMSNSKRRCEH